MISALHNSLEAPCLEAAFCFGCDYCHHSGISMMLPIDGGAKSN